MEEAASSGDEAAAAAAASQGEEEQSARHCVICFSDPGPERVQLQCCEGCFCLGCLETWTAQQNTCPHCRVRVRQYTRPDGRTVALDDRDREIGAEEEEERPEVLDPDNWISDAEVGCIGDAHCKWRSGEFDGLSLSEQIELEGENCSIQCDRCASWFHSFCVGFQSRETLPSEDVDWLCPFCTGALVPEPPQAEEQQQQPAPAAAAPAPAAAAAPPAAATSPRPAKRRRVRPPAAEAAEGAPRSARPRRSAAQPGSASAAAAGGGARRRGSAAAAARRAVAVAEGTPLSDRGSSFQALLAPCTDGRSAAIDAVLRAIAARVTSATTRSFAYRITNPAGGEEAGLIERYDDGGEHGAGERLLQLLQRADVRNVCLVVARWFGGTLLGPDRFRHVVTTARNLLLQERLIGSGNVPAGMGKVGTVSLSTDERVQQAVAMRRSRSAGAAEARIRATDAPAGATPQAAAPAGSSDGDATAPDPEAGPQQLLADLPAAFRKMRSDAARRARMSTEARGAPSASARADAKQRRRQSDGPSPAKAGGDHAGQNGPKRESVGSAKWFASRAASMASLNALVGPPQSEEESDSAQRDDGPGTGQRSAAVPPDARGERKGPSPSRSRQVYAPPSRVQAERFRQERAERADVELQRAGREAGTSTAGERHWRPSVKVRRQQRRTEALLGSLEESWNMARPSASIPVAATFSGALAISLVPPPAATLPWPHVQPERAGSDVPNATERPKQASRMRIPKKPRPAPKAEGAGTGARSTEATAADNKAGAQADEPTVIPPPPAQAAAAPIRFVMPPPATDPIRFVMPTDPARQNGSAHNADAFLSKVLPQGPPVAPAQPTVHDSAEGAPAADQAPPKKQRKEKKRKASLPMSGHAIDAISRIVRHQLGVFYKAKQIRSAEDFKHLSRAITHTIMEKERRDNPVGLTVDGQVKRKIEKYIARLFSKMPDNGHGKHVYVRGGIGCPR